MIQEKLWKQVLKHEEEPVLSLSLRRPEAVGESRAQRRINRYYEGLSRVWRAYWEGTLQGRAAAALEEARETSRPFQPWEAALDYRVALEDDDYLSVVCDATERLSGARPVTVRTAEVWERATGTPLRLADLYRGRPHWRRELVEELRAQAGARLRGGESLFYQDAEERAERDFSPERFYLTADELVIFYPMLCLGSHGEGVPVFPLPRPDFKIKSQKNPEKD